MSNIASVDLVVQRTSLGVGTCTIKRQNIHEEPQTKTCSCFPLVRNKFTHRPSLALMPALSLVLFFYWAVKMATDGTEETKKTSPQAWNTTM